MNKLEMKLNDFRVIDIYYNENDVKNKDVKLLNGEMLSSYIDDLKYPFILFKMYKTHGREWEVGYGISERNEDLTDYIDVDMVKELLELHKKLGIISEDKIKKTEKYIKKLESGEIKF